MEIQSALVSQSLSATVKPASLQNWMVGQVLNATVLEQRTGQQLLLKIENQLVEARTQRGMSVQAGDTLTLRVEQKGDPGLLKVVEQPAARQEQLRQQLFRENLPRQHSLDKLTAALSQTGQAARQIMQALPAPVKKQLQQFLNQLPAPAVLKTGPGLKTAMVDSGLFLEARLATQVTTASQGQPAQLTAQQTGQLLATDLKAGLLRLGQLINGQSTNGRQAAPQTGTGVQASTTAPNINPPVATPAVIDRMPVQHNQSQPPPGSAALMHVDKLNLESLGKQIDAAIARIETHQARAVVTENTPLTNWHFEIPVKDKTDLDLITLDLERHPENADEAQSNSWSVHMRIELQGRGSVSARLSLYAGEMNIAIWSEEEALNQLIAAHTSLLDAQMKRQGLKINQLQHVQHGISDRERARDKPNLINITL